MHERCQLVGTTSKVSTAGLFAKKRAQRTSSGKSKVKSDKDGKDLKIKLGNEHPPMAEWGGKAAYYKNIGIPLSIGAQMIACGDVEVRGVVLPETAIDPLVFLMN